ncbi:MAG: hypothetical protein IT210_19400 [Armatimonadetes bacterium]|nr:hypothetical protein [Armatimonadota bacterium]
MDKYPWYDSVEGGDLEQGDILTRCPIVLPDPELSFPLPEDYIPVVVRQLDVIVMTQSCDLANDKVADVLLCPHWDLDQAGQMDSAFNKASYQQILKGHRPRYCMLARSDILDSPMNVRIVDFGSVFGLPKTYVRQAAAAQGKRLRLCPPYREHLSQAFARFFMRVGLPQDISIST